MSDLDEGLKPFLLVSLGAVIGACIRMHFVSYLGATFPRKYFGTFVVNTSATFGLGLVLSLSSQAGLPNNSSPLLLLVCVGFLGSLSTFSAFVLELLDTFFERRWQEGFLLAVISLLGGLMAAALGYGLGNG